MKVLIATEKPFAAEAVEGITSELQKEGFEVGLLEKYTDKKELLAAVEKVTALIVRSDIIDEEVLGAAKELKIVVRAGAGYDNIDLAAATNRGVVVMNTPGQNANAVAELVIALAIFAKRNFFTPKTGTELKEKTLGIVAFGNIGRRVAMIAKGFDMKVVAYDAYTPASVMETLGVVPASSLSEIFKTADVVSLHLPATPETIKCIDGNLVSEMKNNAILINTARKEIINEVELLEVLLKRTDLKYLTDIKPSNDAEMQAKLPGRYFSTPKKMGAQTAEANMNAGIAAGKQIVDFLKNGVNLYQVNK